MKKYSWIVALLLALSLAFLGCPNDGGKDDDGDDGDDGVVVKADPIDVAFAQDMLDVWGGGEIVAEADGTGFTFTYGTGGNASHGNAVAMFKVNLGEAKVRDYEKVTFTFTGIGGDLGPSTGQYDIGTPKGVNLLAAADKNNLKNFGGNDDGLVTYIVNAYSGAASGENINKAGAKIGDDQPAAIDLELAIAPSRPQASNKGEVYFSFYLHASAEKFASGSGTGEKTSFKITNVTFVPRATALGDVAVDEKDITGVAKPVAGSVGATTITATSQYTGTVTWAPALTDGKFAISTAYTATITLTAKEGFTFTGVAADFFTVANAAATNAANSGVVTAVFPATGAVLGPVYGKDPVDGSYSLNPAAAIADGSGWKNWYGASADGNAVSFTNGGIDYMYPADFDITEYASLVFTYTCVIDTADGEKSAGAQTSFKGVVGSTRTDMGYPTFTSDGTVKTLTYAAPNTSFNGSHTWAELQEKGTDGFCFQVNSGNTDDTFTVTFESIIFYPAED
jgi:hypothetical protein